MYSKNVGVDFDDFCDATLPELKYLITLKQRYPELLVTLFTIPARTSDSTLATAREVGEMFSPKNWLQLAPHGWRHIRGECFAWTDVEAKDKIAAAAERGIDSPIFKAPGWLIDGDTYKACHELGYAVASHETFRIPNTGCYEYVYNSPGNGFISIHGHLTKTSENYIADIKFDIPKYALFRHVYELTRVFTGEIACV